MILCIYYNIVMLEMDKFCLNQGVVGSIEQFISFTFIRFCVTTG